MIGEVSIDETLPVLLERLLTAELAFGLIVELIPGPVDLVGSLVDPIGLGGLYFPAFRV